MIAADTGEPVVRAEVSAEGGTPMWLGQLAARTESVTSGAFLLVLPANRQLTLRAKSPGRSEAQLDIHTGPGPPIDGLELVMGPGEELELDVRVESAFPPGWVSAVVMDAEGRRLAAETIQGRLQMPLRIGSVPPGDWMLEVAAEGGAPVTLPVRVPGPRLAVILPPEGRISVELGDLVTEIGNAELRLLRPGGARHMLSIGGLRLDALPVYSAQAEIPALPAGDWVLELSDDQGRVWRQPVTTTAGETVRVSFD